MQKGTIPIARIALQLYTLREFVKTPEDIAKTMKRVKEIGYDAVQNSALGPIDPTELRRIADGEGIEICASHTGWDQLKNNLDEVIENHHIWGCKVTAIPSMPGEYRSAEGYANFAKEASEIGQKLQEAGIALAYHNHSFEFVRFGERTGLQILFDESDPALLQGELDTYWIQHGGGSPEAWIRNLGDRQPVIHLKDMVIQNNEQTMAEVGEGNLNWPGIIEACREVGVQWYIVEQDRCYRDPFESVAISLGNMKAMGL